MPLFRSARLDFNLFGMDDAADVYACITPEVARFMRWDPPASFEAFRSRREAAMRAAAASDVSLVIRRSDTLECLGVTAIEGIGAPSPEIGLWLRVEAQGRGYGGEAIGALVRWASRTFACRDFTYPVAVQNTASRRIAERLGGVVTGERREMKYDAVVYRIPRAIG